MTLALHFKLNCYSQQDIGTLEQGNLLTKAQALVVIKHATFLLSNDPPCKCDEEKHILVEMNDMSGEIFAGIYSDTKIAKCVGCKTVICKPFWWKTILRR